VDLGFFRRAHGVNTSESQVVSHQRVTARGNALYMAPEQARGDNDNIASSADQFSLGAIIYEIADPARRRSAGEQRSHGAGIGSRHVRPRTMSGIRFGRHLRRGQKPRGGEAGR